ncbi:hypothetical protein E5358_01230 [Palleniella muris]|uniref:Uncharacterized protein n=1 Tax=Palleniella muris TaxID=3038145 RepID=A0AC61QTB5_9BACT|nr:hypothetical protein E5358_01230 [Palleniella muris]
MQTECIKSLLLLLRCSLSYAKIMQTECIKSLLLLLRCSLSYAKVVNIFRESYILRYFFR